MYNRMYINKINTSNVFNLQLDTNLFLTPTISNAAEHFFPHRSGSPTDPVQLHISVTFHQTYCSVLEPRLAITHNELWF